MRAFFYSLLGYFLTPWGLILIGALDSSLIFFLPLGIDFAAIILAIGHSRGSRPSFGRIGGPMPLMRVTVRVALSSGSAA